jgi:perosamine synthetase
MNLGERVNISQIALGSEVEDLVLQVLRSGHIAQGAMVESFENLVAEVAEVEHAVAVSNGTVALEAALEALEVKPGDEVITSPLTFVATLNAILRSGATARFVDINDDFTMNPDAVEAELKPATRVVMPVHLYGLIADMDAIAALAARNGVGVIEDAAQALGSTQHKKAAGSFGVGCFSFYATKNITSGEGGIVTTSDSRIAVTLRLLRNQGMKERYDYRIIGHNWRMTDVAAAIAIPQMKRIGEEIATRNGNADYLNELLRDSDVITPRIPKGRTHVWHQYTVLLPEGADRDGVMKSLEKDGVASAPYYPRLVWDYPPFRENPRVIVGHTPKAANFVSRCLSLPVHPRLNKVDLEHVASSVHSAVRH